jgi:hypothetical protein
VIAESIADLTRRHLGPDTAPQREREGHAVNETGERLLLAT